jgi:hypothetical protein
MVNFLSCSYRNLDCDKIKMAYILEVIEYQDTSC